jgi:hypothetical protein
MKRILIGVGLLAASGIAASVVASSPGGAAPSSPQLLFVNYTARSDCPVLPNYPKAGVVGNAAFDTVRAGQVLVWRYNADPTWSVVRDPARARAKQFPWWGFTRTSCIGDSVATTGRSRATHCSRGGQPLSYPAGRPVPKRVRSARGSCDWVPVQFTVPAAHITHKHRALKHDATLRDPRHLVIGNVPHTWPVDVTGHTLPRGWTEVYVPNARRWGYILTRDLR